MTAKELFPEYEKLFILVMESVGQKIGNEVYQRTSEILESTKEGTRDAIESDIPFGLFICYLIVRILIEIHGVKKLESMDPVEANKLSQFIFDNYLKKPTRAFTAKYGLPVMDNLEYYFGLQIINKRKRNEEF